jgi:hypothetical protein
MGFFELKESGLPAVPWQEFSEKSVFDDRYLWTVRMALYEGSDFNLPRLIGKKADEAQEGARQLLKNYNHNGMVVYYPYFIAEKSGTLQVNNSEIIIEAVEKDLWNLVTYNKKDITFIKREQSVEVHGNEAFFKKNELDELLQYSNKVKSIFRRFILSGKTLLLEWSYAYKTDANNEPIGDKYLVFYEIKEI